MARWSTIAVYDLSDVYFAFEEPARDHSHDTSMQDDILLAYDPLWPKDSQLRLADVMIPKNQIWLSLDPAHRLPGGQDPAFGKNRPRTAVGPLLAKAFR